MHKLSIARGFPASLGHSWSQIRDTIMSLVDVCPRNTVFKIKCSGSEQEETASLLKQKGFVVSTTSIEQGTLCTELKWIDEEIDQLELHSYVSFALPDYSDLSSSDLDKEESHCTYKEEFSAHNCLVRRKRVMDRLHAAERFPTLSLPDDTAVEREKLSMRSEFKESIMCATYLRHIRKQLRTLRDSELLQCHEIDVSDLADADICALQHDLQSWSPMRGANVVFASYRLLGFKELRKVLRVTLPKGFQARKRKKEEDKEDKNEKRIFLVDLDGTVADIDQSLALKFPELKHVIVGRSDSEFSGDNKKMFRTEMTKPGFFLDLPVIEEGAKFVREMLQSAKARVVFVSSPLKNAPHCIPEKIKWIEKHFGFDLARSAIFCKDKTLVRGDFLVDDRPQSASTSGGMKPTWKQVFPPTSYNIQETPRLPERNWMSYFE